MVFVGVFLVGVYQTLNAYFFPAHKESIACVEQATQMLSTYFGGMSRDVV